MTIECSMNAVIHEQSEKFVDEMAAQARKQCDECYGLGYRSDWHGGYPIDPGENACLYECIHCDGTGYQKTHWT